MHNFFVLCVFLLIATAIGQQSIKDTSSSLVKNGGFEDVDPENPAKPSFWNMPDGLGVQWLKVEGSDGKRYGNAIRMNTAISEKEMVAQWQKTGLSSEWDIPEPQDSPVAASYGLSYYSVPIPIQKGQPYRIEFDFKAARNSEGAKVWVRGYGEIRGRKQRIYETIVVCRVQNSQWTSFSQVFHPTKRTPKVTEIRVMLYAYWPVGVYWFDNVRIVPVTAEEYEKESK